jgi:hypothetical protein
MNSELNLNVPRCFRLIRSAIETLNADFSGLTVLTEVGSNHYLLTPLIAAMGDADKVLVLTRDSRYARADVIVRKLEDLAKAWALDHRIVVLSSRGDRRISDADVVTNLGFVRPIDREMIDRLKPTAAIPLMWETWEYREADLDLQYCRLKGMPVLGTDEGHPFLRTIAYVGACAAKALFAAGIEIFGSQVVILGGGPFANSCITMLEAMGAAVSHVNVNARDGFADQLAAASRGADALVVAEHHDRRQLIGGEGGLPPERLVRGSEAPLIVHVCGEMDPSQFEALGLSVYPSSVAPAGTMSLTTDFVGPKPLIDLHTAGLVVGASLARRRLAGDTADQAEKHTLKDVPFAQAFPAAILA